MNIDAKLNHLFFLFNIEVNFLIKKLLYGCNMGFEEIFMEKNFKFDEL